MKQIAPKTWEDIEEVTPDEVDLKMLEEMASDPLCNEFISGNDLFEELK